MQFGFLDRFLDVSEHSKSYERIDLYAFMPKFLVLVELILYFVAQ